MNQDINCGNDIFKILFYCKCISEISDPDVVISVSINEKKIIDTSDEIPIAIWKLMSDYKPVTKNYILSTLVDRGYKYQKVYYHISNCWRKLWFNVEYGYIYTLKKEIPIPITKHIHDRIYIDKLIERDYDICEKVLTEGMKLKDISKLHGLPSAQVSSILYTHFKEVCKSYQQKTGITLNFSLYHFKDYNKNKDFLISQLPLLKENLLSRKWQCLHHKLKK